MKIEFKKLSNGYLIRYWDGKKLVSKSADNIVCMLAKVLMAVKRKIG